MSNDFSAANLKSPGDDPGLDVTDLYVFPAPGNPDKTVMIIDAKHGFKWTGQDGFADKNVLSIALEVPSDMLGADPEIGVWATTSLRREGMLVQMDRGGNPTINQFINPDDAKDEYNARQPVDDVANCLEPWSSGHLSQRPPACRRRVQRPLRMADPRTSRARRPPAAR